MKNSEQHDLLANADNKPNLTTWFHDFQNVLIIEENIRNNYPLLRLFRATFRYYSYSLVFTLDLHLTLQVNTPTTLPGFYQFIDFFDINPGDFLLIVKNQKTVNQFMPE